MCIYIYISVICDSPYHSLQILAHCCLANISKKANLLGPSLDTEDWMKHKSRRSGVVFFRICQVGDDWVVATQMFFIFNPKIGEDEPILTHIFQMGWNHQLGDGHSEYSWKITLGYHQVLL